MKKHFITGLVILLPLVVTIAVVIFLVNFLTDPFIDGVSSLLGKLHIINKGFLFLSHLSSCSATAPKSSF